MPNYEVKDLSRHVAGSIRALMTRHNVSQAELAEAVGVSQSQLSKMVRGVRPIELDQLDAMCVALDADIADVLKEAEDFLSNFDYAARTKLIFVEEGRRLVQPIDTSDYGDLEPIIPPYVSRIVRSSDRSAAEGNGPERV